MSVEVMTRTRPAAEAADPAPAPMAAPVAHAAPNENPPRLRSVVTGMICGLVGAVLATGAFSTGLLYDDMTSVFAVMPLIATLIAIVCSLVAAISDLIE